MATIVNNDTLAFILTDYGLNRVTEALNDPNTYINLTKIKVGDANGEYYHPESTMTSLIHPIPDGEFRLVEKELLEDNETVSLLAVIPETFGGCDIREVGLYETVGGVDILFAVGTQQPFVKPEILDNYLITIDYYIFLKSATLAQVYDKIILDPFTQLVTSADLQDLLSTILFSQTNLMDQIGANSETIGFDRPTQLYNLIVEMRNSSANSMAFSNFSNLVSFTSNPMNIFGYWLFRYPKVDTTSVALTDIGYQGNSLETNKQVNLLSQRFIGDTSFIKFENPNYFSLSNDKLLLLTNDEQTEDEPFSMLFCVNPLNYETDRTLLACSNYATRSHTFEVKELSNGQFFMRIFTDESNYITYTSAINSIPKAPHTIGLTYSPEYNTVKLFINGLRTVVRQVETGSYTHMSITNGTIYGYTATIIENAYVDNVSNPTKIYNEDGTESIGTGWAIVRTNSGKQIQYYGKATTRDSSKDFTLEKLYCWMGYTEADYIYTKDSPENLTTASELYNSDYSPYTGSKFQVALVNNRVVILFEANETEYYESGDIPAKELYCYEYKGTPQYIWANSDVNPTVLLKDNGDEYMGTDWTCSNGVIMYLDQYEATYESEQNKEVAAAVTGSYIINSSNIKTDLINSEVGVISVIKEALSDDQLRLLGLLLYSSAGGNPCVALT